MILEIIAVLIAVFALWAVWRLNKYIQRLEDYLDDQFINRLDNFEDVLKTAIKEDYLKPNFKIKKPLISKDED